MNWLQKLAIKHTLNLMIKATDKLIEKKISFDLDQDDQNDLQEWNIWCKECLEKLNKQEK